MPGNLFAPRPERVNLSTKMSVAEIKQIAAQLPEPEKAELAAWLLDSLPPNSGEDAIEESLAEARLRDASLARGESDLLTSEEFWKLVESGRGK